MLIALTLLVATHVCAGLGIQEMEQCVKVRTTGSRCMNTASRCLRLHRQYTVRTSYKVRGGTIFEMDVRFKNGPTTDIKTVCAQSNDGVYADIAFRY